MPTGESSAVQKWNSCGVFGRRSVATTRPRAASRPGRVEGRGPRAEGRVEGRGPRAEGRGVFTHSAESMIGASVRSEALSEEQLIGGENGVEWIDQIVLRISRYGKSRCDWHSQLITSRANCRRMKGSGSRAQCEGPRYRSRQILPKVTGGRTEKTTCVMFPLRAAPRRELETLLLLVLALRYGDRKKVRSTLSFCREVGRMLTSLIRALDS